MRGTCALCGHDSELIPMLEADEGSVEQEEHLLCKPCDESLAHDDNYVLELAYVDGNAAILNGLSQIEDAGEGLTSLCTLHPSIDRSRICRFAASVLWRAHVSSTVPDCDVGERYAADLRAYLSGQEGFPAHLYLTLVVHLPAPNGQNLVGELLQTPRSSHQRGYFSHSFAVCGLQFLFTAGKESPEPQRVLCLHGARAPYVFATGEDNQRGLLTERPQGLRPTRKLARWLMVNG
jgi:hypothetical protein